MHTVASVELPGRSGSHSTARAVFLEGLGSAMFVLLGCGAGVMATLQPQTSVGALGTAIAYGATLTLMAYVAGDDCHYFNPAVTVGLLSSGRISFRSALWRVVAQVIGAVVGTVLLLQILLGKPGYLISIQGLGANGYAEHSAGGYSLGATLLCECMLSFLLVFIALSLTASREKKILTPALLGVAITVIALFSGPITGGVANPARSTGPALVAGGWALQQLWLFWIAPLLGAAVAGLAIRTFRPETKFVSLEKPVDLPVSLNRRRRAGQ